MGSRKEKKAFEGINVEMESLTSKWGGWSGEHKGRGDAAGKSRGLEEGHNREEAVFVV